MFIDLGVCIAVAIIVFNDQPYANYIVIIASSLPRIIMYFFHEGQKIADNKFEVTETFIDRFRFTSYLIAIGISWTVFTYPFRFIAVIIQKNEKPVRYFWPYCVLSLLLLFLLAGLAQKMGALIAYGITMSLGLLWRDFIIDNPKDWGLYFFEFLCFWVVCVPVFFEANTFFPLMLVITALYGIIIVLFGSFRNAKTYWEKSQYGLHFFDFCTKGFALGFVLPVVGYSLWLLFMYGYQYFSSLIGQFISF